MLHFAHLKKLYDYYYLYVNCNSILVCELCLPDKLGHSEPITSQCWLKTLFCVVFIIYHLNQLLWKTYSFAQNNLLLHNWQMRLYKSVSDISYAWKKSYAENRFYKLDKMKFRAQSLLYTGSKMMYLIWKNVRHINQAISKIRSFSELAVWMCSVKTVFLKFLQNFSRKHLRWCISLTKLQAKGVRTVNWIWKIFKNTFCMKQLQRLLLAFKVSKVYLFLLVNMKPYILVHTLPPSLYMHA